VVVSSLCWLSRGMIGGDGQGLCVLYSHVVSWTSGGIERSPPFSSHSPSTFFSGSSCPSHWYSHIGPFDQRQELGSPKLARKNRRESR
jgi:hypothetical protein